MCSTRRSDEHQAMIREAASEAAEGLDQPLDVLASLRGADVEHVRPLDPISSRDPSRLVLGHRTEPVADVRDDRDTLRNAH